MRSGTSHEDWVATIDGRFRKVTVDCPKAPFSQELISSMAVKLASRKSKFTISILGASKQGAVAPRRNRLPHVAARGTAKARCLGASARRPPAPPPSSAYGSLGTGKAHCTDRAPGADHP